MGIWQNEERKEFINNVILEQNEKIEFSLWGKLISPDDTEGRGGILLSLTNKYLYFFRHGTIRDSLLIRIPFQCILEFNRNGRSLVLTIKENNSGTFDYRVDGKKFTATEKQYSLLYSVDQEISEYILEDFEEAYNHFSS